jgi:hypothetical protein
LLPPKEGKYKTCPSYAGQSAPVAVGPVEDDVRVDVVDLEELDRVPVADILV